MAIDITPPPGGFAGPVKRSVTIAGHQSSVSLEPLFWNALEAAARARAVPLSALVAAIDAVRIASPAPANLASTLRTWLLWEAADLAPEVAGESTDFRGNGVHPDS